MRERENNLEILATNLGFDVLGFDPFKELIESKMFHNVEERKYNCIEPGCTFSHNSKQKVYNHIDSRHVDSSYQCPNCPTVCPTKNAVLTHGYRTHKNKPDEIFIGFS